jgi:hypothetical protein
MDQTRPATVRCPTCRASQEWSSTCRRCKCDLELLRAVDLSYNFNRRRCLMALHEDRLHEARRLARHCHWLRPSADSRRLLALCALLGGEWANALALAHETDN